MHVGTMRYVLTSELDRLSKPLDPNKISARGLMLKKLSCLQKIQQQHLEAEREWVKVLSLLYYAEEHTECVWDALCIQVSVARSSSRKPPLPG